MGGGTKGRNVFDPLDSRLFPPSDHCPTPHVHWGLASTPEPPLALSLKTDTPLLLEFDSFLYVRRKSE